jgi:BirA family biotin operon repressor/biotin-[acetyl-CoA-carboxylase] ligase
VLGVGLNVALRAEDFPPELRDRAGTLGLEPEQLEGTLERLLAELEEWIAADAAAVLAVVRERDALLDRPVRWSGGEGVGAGIDGDGRLIVMAGDERLVLDAGEVHLGA